MNHAQLSNAAKASRITLPDPDHPKYDLVLRAQANAELMRREARRLAEDDLYYFCTVVLGYGEMLESLHRPGYVTGTFHARFLDGDPRLPILRLRDAACPRAHRARLAGLEVYPHPKIGWP